MRQSGHWGVLPLTESKLRELLEERFMSVDYDLAKSDVRPFLRDTRTIDLWSADFFIQLGREHLIIDSNSKEEL